MRKLQEGTIIYHHTGNTKATVIKYIPPDITIELSEKIAGKNFLTLPISHMGEWLFFDESDKFELIEHLAMREEYFQYCNKKIIETRKKILNVKKKPVHCENKAKDLLVTSIVKEEKNRYQTKKPALLQKTIKSDGTTSKVNVADISHLFRSNPGRTSNYEKLSNEELQRIKEVVEKRKIPFLVHFTRIENLASILDYGLVPVKRQKEMNIDSIRNDEIRIDERLDCTSISVGYPNYKLFYSFRNQKYPGSRWVIIFIKKDLLYNNDNYAYFCKTNAARVCSGRNDLSLLRNSNSLENMFCESIVYNDDYSSREITREKLDIPDFYPTDPQAEILIGNIIKVENIAWIGFQNSIDRKYFCEELGKEFLSKFDLRESPGLFEARSDYRFWRKDV